ncbi:hypothetical protein GIB67_002090 [Kingdonia uniflora]|uniref:Uncharacterized protein n=1 Tax=Kingdonia uniflora TaxID=39325 RepID=A0A7J7KWD4_9MAGN|nr:hypothetical protein GIB67_002090 [Kingdonia uniflora]
MSQHMMPYKVYCEGVPVRTTNRPGSQLLGVNGRDDGPPVLSLIPKELDGECFEEALARVCRCIGGGTAQDNGDSDSDLEVVAETVSVNLRCPWQCPICLKNYSLENLIIDPYFNRITTMMLDCEEDVTDIDVKPDGSWRVKNETERWNLVQWHSPNGSLSAPTVPEMKPGLETLKQVKQEGGSEGYTGLKLGIKKNHNGIWEVNKAEDTLSLSSENRSEKKPKTRSQKTMPTSSSAAGSYRDGEDPSVNDDGGGRFDFSMNNANELDSLGLSFESAYGATNRVPSAPRGNTDVIFLSDSDDETLNEVLPEAGINFSMPPPGVPDAYLEEPDVGNGDIDLFNGGNDEIEMHPWSLPMGTQAGPRLQLFGSEVEVSDTLAEVQTVKHTPSNCHGPMNGTPSKTDVSSIQVPVSDFRANANGSGGLFNKSLALGGDDDDTSLQIFLPSHTAREEAQGGANNQPILSSVVNTEDWISLRLGGGGSTNNVESTSTNGFNSRDKLSSKEGRMDTLADTVVIMLKMQNVVLHAMMVDTGSSIELLFQNMIDQMGLVDKVKPSDVDISGFILPITGGPAMVDIVFYVFNARSYYLGIRGRCWLHNMRAIPSPYHLALGFEWNGGIYETKGSQKLAQACKNYVTTMTEPSIPQVA